MHTRVSLFIRHKTAIIYFNQKEPLNIATIVQITKEFLLISPTYRSSLSTLFYIADCYFLMEIIYM